MSVGDFGSLLTWVFDKFYQSTTKNGEIQRKQVATYLASMSRCLSVMAQTFRKNEIPREAGHEYEGYLRELHDMLLLQVDLAPEVKQTINDVLWQLYEVAAYARSLDYIEQINNKTREDHIQELERMAGDLRAPAIRLWPDVASLFPSGN